MSRLPDVRAALETRSGGMSTDRPGPTVFEIWSPTCVECRAMRPDLESVASRYTDRVRLELVNAIDELDTVQELGVKGTPTLIGVRDGEELFRVVGRRSRSELELLFEAVEAGDTAPTVGPHETLLRVGAGVGLVGIGLVSGQAWPLVVVGVAIISLSVISWLRR